MILYFSATGNTEFIAKELAKCLDDDCLNLLKRIKENDYSEIKSDKPFIICTPIYVCESPRFLIKYLKKVKLNGNNKIYFIFTSGGYAGIAKYFGKKIARRQHLKYMGRAEFKMPRNYIASDAYPMLEKEEMIRRIKNSKELIPLVSNNIKNEEKLKGRHVWLFEYLITLPFTPIWIKLKFKTKKFYAKDNCVGCKKCVNVCPLNNINLIDNKPSWGNSCTHCMACISNCPKEAIEYGTITLKKEKYRISKYLDEIKE